MSAKPIHPIHPIQCLVQGRSIWLPWRSVDLPEQAIASDHSGILWADTLQRLVERCRCAGTDAPIEASTICDFDQVLAHLLGDGHVSPDEVINCWNLLDDIGQCLVAHERVSYGSMINRAEDVSFHTSHRYLSITEAGRMLGLEAQEIGAHDRSVAAAALSDGMLMLLQATQLRSA